MIHEVLAVGPLGCNCSVLGDEVSREAMVVDPGDEIERIVAILERHHLQVKQIIVTHAHIDHIAGAARLKRLTGAPILYNQLDLPLVAIMDQQAEWLGIETPEVTPPDDDLPEGRRIVLGSVHQRQSLRLQDDGTPSGIVANVLHTPGHTPGSICLHLPSEQLLLAGDTLFAGSVGRTDLPGGDTRTLLHSIHDKLLALPDETVVLPGHGSRTSIGEEREQNPFLR